MDILNRIDRLRAFLSGNVTLGDAAHIWVEAIAGEIESSPCASKDELAAVKDLRCGVSAVVTQFRDGRTLPDSSAAIPASIILSRPSQTATNCRRPDNPCATGCTMAQENRIIDDPNC